jgi:ABC-2 type transport system ATP-binding protein
MSIVVQGVTKLYNEQKALDNVSFEIKTGEIVGFLGPNGAGKSTMMKIITGFVPATTGTISVNDIEVATDNLEIRKQIGYLPENNPLYPEMYVREYLGFVASMYKSQISRKNQIDNIIEKTGLVPEQKKKIGALSKGYRQRVGLAQALIHNPSVLILDEATTGLDPNQIVEIRNLIREAGKEKTVMLSTHIMQEVEAICDRVIIIDKGVIVANEVKSDIYSIIKRSRQIIHIEFDKEINELVLTVTGRACSVKKLNNKTWIVESDGDDDIRPLLFNYAVENNLTVLSLQKQESNLEEVFRHLTNG